MSKVKIQLNRQGVRSLLRSEEMRAICQEKAAEIRARCPAGYQADSYTGKNRVNAMVWAESAEARRDNAKNNTILKALR